MTWIRENLGTLFLSFILAITAWVAAISQEDPLSERVFGDPVPVSYQGLQEGLTIVGSPPQFAEVTLRAPNSVWQNISIQDLSVVGDLAGLEAGVHRIRLEDNLQLRAAKVTAVEPATVTLTIEALATKRVEVQVQTRGEVAPGYRDDPAQVDVDQVTITGPASVVGRVNAAEVIVDLNNRQRTVDASFDLTLVDVEGDPVEGLQIDQATVRVVIAITKLENLATKLVIPIVVGQDELEATGYYRVTRVNVSPSEVAVFSADPAALEGLPAFVQTLPIDVSAETRSVDTRVELDLPPGFSLIGEQNVRVQIDIEPIETSLTISRTIEVLNLGLGLYAYPSPQVINIILSGPAVVLDALQRDDIHATVDVDNLSLGTFQLEPKIEGIPEGISWEPPTPSVIEVTLTAVPRPTPTPLRTPES
jgi:YbbR domain-containing protein